MSGKRIAFTGASGSGKTTLAKGLSRELGIPMLSLSTRGYAKEHWGFDNPYDVDNACSEVYHEIYNNGVKADKPAEECRVYAAAVSMNRAKEGTSLRAEFQRGLLQEKMDLEVRYASAGRGFISDRSVLDVLVYSMMHCPEAVTREVYFRCLNHTDKYTHLLYTPRCEFHNPEDDGVRKTDSGYHFVFETILDKVLSDGTHYFMRFDDTFRYTRVLGGNSKEQRLQHALDLVKS